MKSYTLPAIIAASVIAVATLLYALFFQGQDPEQAESVLVENSIIAEPTTNTQTSVAPATTSEERCHTVINWTDTASVRSTSSLDSLPECRLIKLDNVDACGLEFFRFLI